MLPERLPLTVLWSIYVHHMQEILKEYLQSRAFSRFAVEKNYIPMAPHLLFPQFINEATERWLGLKMGFVLLGKCEQVWVFGDLISEGMAAEIEKAKKQRKTIRYFTEDLKEVGHEDSLWQFQNGEKVEKQ